MREKSLSTNLKIKADLSIIVISYNTLELTQECLASVFQEAPNCSFEVIVVDNNSEDGSARMITGEFPSVRLIENKENKGFAAANNQGFEIATGKNFLLLNSDTIVMGDVLQQSVDFLIEHQEVGAMGCRVLNTDGTTQLTCSMFPSNLNLLIMTTGLDRLRWPKFLSRYQMRYWDRDTVRDVEVISGCYLLIRAELVKSVGALDEDFFFFGEETEWCERIRDAGWALRFAPVGEIIHHGGGSVKKLNYKRDVMLSRATILLHKKSRNLFSAIVCFFILVTFNFSRAVFWTLRSLFDEKAKSRALHFRSVVSQISSTWPKGI